MSQADTKHEVRSTSKVLLSVSPYHRLLPSSELPAPQQLSPPHTSISIFSTGQLCVSPYHRLLPSSELPALQQLSPPHTSISIFSTGQHIGLHVRDVKVYIGLVCFCVCIESIICVSVCVCVCATLSSNSCRARSQ